MAQSAALAHLLAGQPPRIGPFRLLAELGEGGFAPVFLAAEEYGGVELRTVAIKLFALDALIDPRAGTGGATEAARARIVDEARALCHVEHPNVVRFHQLVEGPGGVLGLAMEHLAGRSLADRLDDPGRLPLAEALEVGARVASALAAVHEVGLVHRDVKPGNVIETASSHKLIDFGIATPSRRRPPSRAPSAHHRVGVSAAPRALSGRVGAVVVSVDATLTAPELRVATGDPTQATDRTVRASEGEDAGTDAVAGTMGYIDPVCLSQGEPADASSDLYGLGAMLYQCLTGRVPASAGDDPSTPAVRLNVAFGLATPTPLRELAPEVPEAVARLIDALVAPRREDRPQRAAWVACELERLRRLERGGARALPAEPFRGLGVFDPEHRDVFFGRATEVASAVDHLRSRGLLALVGPSGSGKSSLARAGVVPAVLDGALGAWPPRWCAVLVSPGARPRASLARALAGLLGGAELPDPPDALRDTLAALVQRTDTGIVVLVDALEEVVTLAGAEERAYLAAFLAALAARPLPGLRAVATARRDLLDPLLGEAALGAALPRAVQLVAPLTATAWVDVVDQRLAAYGYALEDAAMRDALARELAGAAEAMPLVEFALGQLWERRDRQRRVLSRAALAELGGLAGALSRHAEATLSALVDRRGPAAAAAAGEVLLALTTPHGTRATRTRDELAAEVPDRLREEVLAAFEQARLLAVDDGKVTLAHDALIARWPRLDAWVQSVRKVREAARDVEEAAARWQAFPDRDRLLRGGPLRDARALLTAPRARLSAAARVFLAASLRSDRRAAAVVVLGASAALLGLGVLGGLYVHDTKAAEGRSQKDKEATFAIMKAIAEARERPGSAAAREVEELVRKEHACQKALSQCSGSPAPSPSR